MSGAFFTFFFLIVSISSYAQSLRSISIGEAILVPLNSSQIWLENSKIIKATAQGSNLKIRGIGIGISQLQVGNQTYQFEVYKPETLKLYDKLSSLQPQLVGIQFELKNPFVVIQGKIHRWVDWQKITQKYIPGSDLKMNAQVSELTKKEVFNFLQSSFTKQRLPSQVLPIGESDEIRLGQKNLVPRYAQILNPFGYQVIYDETSVEIAPVVKVEITVAEVKRDFGRKIGVNWPESYQAQLIQPLAFSASGKLSINALEKNGVAKVLANPNLICRSNKEAEFMAGGEIPIKIMNRNVHDVVWKKYGVLLKIKPQADLSGRISLSINTEISSIDKANSVDDMPAMFTNSVSSHFDLVQSKTIMLSGLIKSDSQQSNQGLPWLTQIPILGVLFGSQDFRENRSELVIFVTPTIIKDEVTQFGDK